MEFILEMVDPPNRHLWEGQLLNREERVPTKYLKKVVKRKLQKGYWERGFFLSFLEQAKKV